MLALLLFSLNAFAADPLCLDGYYDLGPQAAALSFQCSEEPGIWMSAKISFCERDVLLKTGHCAADQESLPCEWNPLEAVWRCQERNEAPFIADLRRLTPQTISYHFRSGYNEGELQGTMIR
ncbi:MAG: hypothetical protein ACXVB9_06015 [Bdellovibrionota bacterium]